MNKTGLGTPNLNERLKQQQEAAHKEIEDAHRDALAKLEASLKQTSYDVTRTIERDFNARMNKLVTSVEIQNSRLDATLAEIETRPWWSLKTTVIISAVTGMLMGGIMTLIPWMFLSSQGLSAWEMMKEYRQIERELAEKEKQLETLWGITPLPMSSNAQMIALPANAQIRERCREAGRICVLIPE